MVAAVKPVGFNIPVYHKRAGVPVGYARVDDYLVDTINAIGPWYLADLREKATPRCYLRDQSGVRRLLPLSRAVMGIMTFVANGQLKMSEVYGLPRDQIYTMTRHFSRIGFADSDPYNCTLANLLVGPGINASQRLKLVQSRTVEPVNLASATPQPPDPLLEPLTPADETGAGKIIANEALAILRGEVEG